MATTGKRAFFRLFLFGLVLIAFISVTACKPPVEQQTDTGSSGVSSGDLNGVWELVIAATGQTSNIFLYFDGAKMYSAVKAGQQFMAVPQGTPFLEYKNGKLQYGIAGTMAEFIGKKNGENIDLYAKVNGQPTSVVSYILKPSTVNKDTIKNAGSGGNGGNDQPGRDEISLNATQQALYDGFITGLVSGAQGTELPAATVQTMLSASNISTQSAGFKIVDKQPNTAIAQGTTAESLKGRFKTVAAGNSGGQTGEPVTTEELKGVWELGFVVIPPTPLPFKLLVYFDGEKMYAAANMNGDIIPLPEGTPFLEYKDGKLQYGVAGTMAEFIGKKNGENIDLYAKVNGIQSQSPVYILKPSRVKSNRIKYPGKEPVLTANPVLNFTQIPSSEVTASTKVKITLKGANLFVAESVSVRFYNEIGEKYGLPIAINTSDVVIGEILTFEGNLPVPQDEGVYTVKVLFDDFVEHFYCENPSNYGDPQNKIRLTNPSLQVYGQPQFTGFMIPKTGIGKTGDTVTAAVLGVNFTAPGISGSNFEVSCTDNPSVVNNTTVQVLRDSVLAVTLTIPSEAGDYTIRIANGAESLTGTFRVKDYGDYSTYTAGTIVLKDGTFVSKDAYTAIAADNPPVAIVVGVNDYGIPIGVGLHRMCCSAWARILSIGEQANFTGIVCTPSATGDGAADTATFAGDKDGSDNWEYICKIDPEGTANATEKYQAFHWVNEYGRRYDTGAKVQWYLPSLAELCAVYKNREAINASLAKIHGLDSTAADNGYDTPSPYYWSSSQHDSSNGEAWLVDFKDGGIEQICKGFDYRVCCLTGF